MITNLVFKRVNKRPEGDITELKIVKAEIPEINRGEGWQLISSGDVVLSSGMENDEDEPTQFISATQIASGASFISNISGTARLVRKDSETILIAYRKGSKLKNQTTPQSVCIDDNLKFRFFNDCKVLYGGGANKYIITTRSPIMFDKWVKIMSEEYEKQLAAVNQELKVEETDNEE